jgi:hypothetical protein
MLLLRDNVGHVADFVRVILGRIQGRSLAVKQGVKSACNTMRSDRLEDVSNQHLNPQA